MLSFNNYYYLHTFLVMIEVAGQFLFLTRHLTSCQHYDATMIRAAA